MNSEIKRTNRVKVTAEIGPMVDAYYSEVKRARAEGRLVAWWTGFPALQPLLAMDIAYVHTDGYAAGAAARKAGEQLFGIAEAARYPRDCCSYFRLNMGNGIAAIKDIELTGVNWLRMPRPDFVVTVSMGCNLHSNVHDCLSDLFKVPAFYMDIPWVADDADIGDCIAAATRQLKEFIRFLEDITGRPFSWDKLREAMVLTKRTAQLRMDAMALCRNIPSPASFFDWLISLAPVNFLIGRREPVEHFEKFKVELEWRVSQKIGCVTDEKYRLLWDGLMVWPKVGNLAEKFAARNACIVGGRYPYFAFWNEPDRIDPGRPLESLADAIVCFHLNRNLEWLIDATSKLCEEYRIDGIIVHMSRTCRAWGNAQLDLIEGVTQKTGIPAMFFEADHTDETHYVEAVVDTKIDALIENIAARRRVH